MTTVEMTSPDIRTAALALAEEARRRPRGDEATPVSRSLARTLAEHAGSTVPSLIVFADAELMLLCGALRGAAGSWSAVHPGGRYADRVDGVRLTAPDSLLARLGA